MPQDYATMAGYTLRLNYNFFKKLCSSIFWVFYFPSSLDLH
ncbi:hypothetical protein PL11201_180038 [Planktothrix sp. PCC 11201]|nr:hypothetical protein PL11201_180038 [Planktothrix sp. PCC 11201]